MPQMNPVVTWLFGFLTGAITGAAGKYLADKYTDRRKEKEASAGARQKFRSTEALVPSLMAELRSDVLGGGNELVREFLLVQNERVQFANPKPRFVYYREKYPDLDSMVDILEDAGFVADITTGGIKTYRMSNEFIELLRSTS
jgi:hypothetical protein